jgi:membrane protein implicated in regulation of membrane protease activity
MAEPPRRTRNPGVYWVAGVLLLIAIVMPLMVPLYAKEDPTFAGIPFFFWYQFLWIPVTALLTTICYRIVSRQGQRDRQASDR